MNEKVDELVMDYAVAMAATMYHLTMASECGRQALASVKSAAIETGRQGIGSRIGKGGRMIADAADPGASWRALEGNHEMAKVAADIGIKLPKDEDVYAEAVKRGVIPADYVPFR